jgi:YggT family protein
MINILITIIQTLGSALLLVVIVDVLLSYFLAPYHPLRSALDRIVEPLLNPIRRVVPALGMIDFSPVILVILIQVVETVLILLLNSLR